MKKKSLIDNRSNRMYKSIWADQRGQADIIGNILSIIFQHPWLGFIVFLAIIYATTFSFSIAGINFSLYQFINFFFIGLANAFNINFDFRFIIILAFLTPIAIFLLKGHNW